MSPHPFPPDEEVLSFVVNTYCSRFLDGPICTDTARGTQLYEHTEDCSSHEHGPTSAAAELFMGDQFGFSRAACESGAPRCAIEWYDGNLSVQCSCSVRRNLAPGVARHPEALLQKRQRELKPHPIPSDSVLQPRPVTISLLPIDRPFHHYIILPWVNCFCVLARPSLRFLF